MRKVQLIVKRLLKKPTGALAIVAGILSVVSSAGCERAAEPKFVSSPEVAQLEPELRAEVQQELRKWCGTATDPKLLGGDPKDTQTLELGADVYRRNCEQCHGVTGDGAGPAAEYLTPRPRDYRRGIFKFTSTPYGYKPRPEDLRRTIERGIVGTSMPSFRRMPKKDLDAVVQYVLALTHRGELERLLAAHAESEGELDDETTQALVESIENQWADARENVVEPDVKMPPITADSIAAGAAIFQKRECFKCHGHDGRGGLAGGIEVGNDAWGRKDPAADLTSGMLHGGQSPTDIYRRISSGINGTPMPAFRESFADKPESIWDLTHYVLSLADQRRRGVQFPIGAAKAAAETTNHQSEPEQAETAP